MILSPHIISNRGKYPILSRLSSVKNGFFDQSVRTPGSGGDPWLTVVEYDDGLSEVTPCPKLLKLASTVGRQLLALTASTRLTPILNDRIHVSTFVVGIYNHLDACAALVKMLKCTILKAADSALLPLSIELYAC